MKGEVVWDEVHGGGNEGKGWVVADEMGGWWMRYTEKGMRGRGGWWLMRWVGGG